MAETNNAYLSTISPAQVAINQNNFCGKKNTRASSSKQIDSMIAYEKQEEKAVLFLDAPTLKSGKLATSSDYLADLNSAYIAIYKQLTTGLQNQIGSLSSIETLSQTMSTLVMDSSDQAMAKELHEATLIKNVINEENTEGLLSEIMGDIFSFGLAPLLQKCGASDAVVQWVTLGIGIAAMLGAVAFTIATAGAGAEVEDAAVVNEVGDIDEFANGGRVANQLPQANVRPPVQEDLNVGASGDLNEGGIEGIDSDLEDAELDDQNNQQIVNQQQNNALNPVNEEDDESESVAIKKLCQFLKGLGKRVVGASITGVFSTPEAIQCITSSYIATYKHQLAGVQRKLGPVLGNLQLENAIFTYYQHLIQRGVNLSGNFGDQLSNALQNISSINLAYRDIATGLAQAV